MNFETDYVYACNSTVRTQAVETEYCKTKTAAWNTARIPIPQKHSNSFTGENNKKKYQINLITEKYECIL